VSSRAVRASDTLTVTVTIDSIRQAGRHSIITTRSEVTTTAGEHVCTAYSTLVERGDPE
jgi:acyl dehydratase